jgi:hypothetical protein
MSHLYQPLYLKLVGVGNLNSVVQKFVLGEFFGAIMLNRLGNLR